MGIMVLVLTPCLYCNVSDSWMLPNKWHRACIGAAGIYVEVVLASICTFLWWVSEPGLFHNLCLNVMFVCSTSTIVFNANPLLRYDGYYVLADLVEIPNLRQKATTILSRKLGEWCLGLEPPDDPFLPQRNQVFFALYSDRGGGLSLGGGVFDLLVPLQVVPVVRSGDRRPVRGDGLAMGIARSCRYGRWPSSFMCRGGSNK